MNLVLVNSNDGLNKISTLMQVCWFLQGSAECRSSCGVASRYPQDIAAIAADRELGVDHHQLETGFRPAL
jgi:uncharacterized protein YPO0396